MKKLIIVLVSCLFLCGCKNHYRDSVVENLNDWSWWQERYYIQEITTHETLEPHYIHGVPYVNCWVTVVSKGNPYRKKLFEFFIRKDYPSQHNIFMNEKWWDFIKEVKRETNLLTEE